MTCAVSGHIRGSSRHICDATFTGSSWLSRELPVHKNTGCSLLTMTMNHNSSNPAFSAAIAAGRAFLGDSRRSSNNHPLPYYIGSDDVSEEIYDNVYDYVWEQFPHTSCTCHSGLHHVYAPNSCDVCVQRRRTFVSMFDMDIRVAREREINLTLDELQVFVREMKEKEVMEQDFTEHRKKFALCLVQLNFMNGVQPQAGAAFEEYMQHEQEKEDRANTFEDPAKFFETQWMRIQEAFDDWNVKELKPEHKKMCKVLEALCFFIMVDYQHCVSPSTWSVYGYSFLSKATGMCAIELFDWLRDYIVDIDYKPQAGESDIPMLDDTHKFLSGTAVSRMKKFVFALTAIGVGKAMDVTIEKTTFECLWTTVKNMFDKVDIFASIFDFVLWLIKNLRDWMTGQKSVRSIFLDENAAEGFDKRVALLASTAELLKVGDTSRMDVMGFAMELAQLEVLAEREMIKAKDNKIMRIAIARQLSVIAAHQADMLIIAQQKAIRCAPFAVVLHGGTSVGKSTMCGMITPMLTKAMGAPTGPQHNFNWDPNEKYASGYTPMISSICLDDLANIQPEYATVVAPEMVLFLINNCKRMAIMAGLEDKGKIQIDPVLVMATANAPNLGAEASVCPLSILRRFNYHLDIRLKPCCSTSSMFKTSSDHNPADHNYDCWIVDVYHYIPHVDRPKDGTREYDLTSASFSDTMIFLAAKAKEYNAGQKALVEYMNNVHKADMCKHDVFVHICLKCKEQKAREALVEREQLIADAVGHFAYTAMSGSNPLQYVYDGAVHHCEQAREKMTEAHMVGRLKQAIRTNGGWHRASKLYFAYVDIRDKPLVKEQVWFSGVTCFLTWFACFQLMVPMALATSLFALCGVATVAVSTTVRVGHTLRMKVPQTLVVASKMARRALAHGVRDYMPVILIVTMCSGMYAVYRRKYVSQGSRASLPVPTTCVNYKDIYRPVAVESVDRNVDSMTATSADLSELLSRSLHTGFFTGPGIKDAHCAISPLCSGYWMVPYHLLQRGFTEVTIIKSDSTCLNDRRVTKLAGSWERIGDSDMCIVNIPVMGDRKDIMHLFPSKSANFKTKSAGALCVWAQPKTKTVPTQAQEFVVIEKGVDKININTGVIKVEGLDYTYQGGHYNFSRGTFDGMCGSVIILDNTGPFIAGYHSAGVEGQQKAVFTTVYREDVQLALSTLCGRGAHVQMSQSGDWATRLNFSGTAFGHQFTTRPWATSEYVLGQHYHLGFNTAPKRTFRSMVVNTSIAESVCGRFGIDIMHERPKYMNHFSPFNTFMSAAGNPSDVDYETLNKAMNDYVYDIHDFWDKHPEHKWDDRLHPLTHDAILAGADGVKGCYSVNLNSSMGIPWCNTKKNYLKPSERETEGISRPLDISPEIMVEVEKAEEIMLRGERPYFPHRCNLKDEPVKIGKDKVRVFMGSNFVYLYHMRKYFLTASMLIQDYPELFESAVGVNCASRQWTTMHDHVFKYGKDRCIAGDYIKYDQKFCIKVNLASFKVLLGMLKRAGYTDEQLAVCTVLMTETALAVYDVNGEWIMFASMNPSGHGLTVVINGLGNSLYARCAFYKLKPEREKRRFRQLVALMTYGDDNVMSVHKDASWFNHTSVQLVLNEYGMGYTMADKEAESVPYINQEDCSFLKRQWVWSEQYNRYLCPLETTSIFKSLTVNKKSGFLTEDQQAAEVINNANREFFFHGREKFDEAHANLTSIAVQHEVLHHLPKGKLATYDEVEQWYLDA